METLKDYIKSDIYCYYGKEYRSLREYFCISLELKYIITYRKAALTPVTLLRMFYKLYLIYLSHKTQIQISSKTRIGKGLYIGHLRRVIINSDAILGNNVNLSLGVTIGWENRGRRTRSPTLENNIWVGTNAVIVGKIKIGNDVLIAPNAFVNFDVPDHCIVIGNPVKIHFCPCATENYLNYTVS